MIDTVLNCQQRKVAMWYQSEPNDAMLTCVNQPKPKHHANTDDPNANSNHPSINMMSSRPSITRQVPPPRTFLRSCLQHLPHTIEQLVLLLAHLHLYPN